MDNQLEAINEWRKIRIAKFTSSEISKLLVGGKRPMTDTELAARVKRDKRTTIDTMFGDVALNYIRSKVAETLTGEIPPLTDAKSLAWGKENEKDAVLSAEKEWSIEIEYFGIEAPKFFLYNKVSGGSPDGLIKGADSIVEVKCPYNTSNHVEFLLMSKAASELDTGNEWFAVNHPEYYAQMQMNMMACKKSECLFISYDPRMVDHEHRLASFVIKKDEAFCKELDTRIEAARVIAKDILLTLRPQLTA